MRPDSADRAGGPRPRARSTATSPVPGPDARRMLGCALKSKSASSRTAREVGDLERHLDAPFVLARHLALDEERERLAQRQASSPRPRRAGCRVGPGWRSVSAASASRGASHGPRYPSQKLPPATAAYASSGRSSSGFGRTVSAGSRARTAVDADQVRALGDPRVPAGVLDVLSDDVRSVINAHPTAADHHPVRARRSAATAPNRRWCRPPPHSRRGPSGSDPATGRTAAGPRTGASTPLRARSGPAGLHRWCRAAAGPRSRAATTPDAPAAPPSSRKRCPAMAFRLT